MPISLKLKDARVVFTPSGKRGYFPVGTPVLQAPQTWGVDIDSVCGGRGLCGRCQVVQATGNFSKHKINKLTGQKDYLLSKNIYFPNTFIFLLLKKKVSSLKQK